MPARLHLPPAVQLPALFPYHEVLLPLPLSRCALEQVTKHSLIVVHRLLRHQVCKCFRFLFKEDLSDAHLLLASGLLISIWVYKYFF